MSSCKLTYYRTARLHKEVSKIEADIEDIKYVSPSQVYPLVSTPRLTRFRAKNAEDRPKTEDAKRVNENLRKELGELKNEQSRLILEFDESKRERSALVEKAVSCCFPSLVYGKVGEN